MFVDYMVSFNFKLIGLTEYKCSAFRFDQMVRSHNELFFTSDLLLLFEKCCIAVIILHRI